MSVSGYAEMALTSLKRLAEFQSKCPPELVDEIREINDDAISDTFYGTVESLNGDVGPDERRSGEVTFALLYDQRAVKQTK